MASQAASPALDETSPVYAVRREAGLSEHWVVVLVETDPQDVPFQYDFYVIDPVMLRWRAVARPPLLSTLISQRHFLHLQMMPGADKEVLVHGYDLSEQRILEEMLCLDALARQ